MEAKEICRAFMPDDGRNLGTEFSDISFDDYPMPRTPALKSFQSTISPPTTKSPTLLTGLLVVYETSGSTGHLVIKASSLSLAKTSVHFVIIEYKRRTA